MQLTWKPCGLTRNRSFSSAPQETSVTSPIRMKTGNPNDPPGLVTLTAPGNDPLMRPKKNQAPWVTFGTPSTDPGIEGSLAMYNALEEVTSSWKIPWCSIWGAKLLSRVSEKPGSNLASHNFVVAVDWRIKVAGRGDLNLIELVFRERTSLGRHNLQTLSKIHRSIDVRRHGYCLSTAAAKWRPSSS